MCWMEIRAGFEALATKGDFVAEWHFAPDAHSREDWELHFPEELGPSDGAMGLLAAAGQTLENEFRGSRLLPRRIFEVNDSPVEMWLSALRRIGINVQYCDEPGWRVDRGAVQGVIVASIAFCAYLSGDRSLRTLESLRIQAQGRSRDYWSREGWNGTDRPGESHKLRPLLASGNRRC